MAFTKIVGAGIHTLSNVHTHNINSSGIITATNFVGPFDGTTGDFSGNVTIGGNLVVNGDTTTLNTTLREVELLRVDAQNDNVAAGIITQRGAGNILEFFDASANVGALTDEGNLGLGSNLTSPNVKLHVKSTATGGGNIAYFDDTGSGNTGRLMILTTGGAATDGVKLQAVNRKYLHFGNATNQFTIDNNNSRVGINSTSPANKLDVALGAAWIYPNENGDEAIALKLGKLEAYNSSLNDILVSDDNDRVVNKINRYVANWHFDRTTSPGATRINAFQLKAHDSGSYIGNSFIIRDLSNTADSIKLWTNGNSFVGVTTDGTTRNFGIGTNNPTERLTVYGTNSDTTPILGLRSGNNHATTNNGAQIAFGHAGINHYQHFIHTRHNGSNSHNAIDFYVCDGTQQNTVTSGSVHTLSMVSGKVGINSTSPREKLDVIGNANIIVDNNKGIKLGYRGESKTAYIGLDANDNANAGSQSWANSAYIGFYSDGSSERSIKYRTSAGSHIFQGVNGTEFARIAADGKIGIGVTNPNNPLTIHGSGNHIYMKDTATNNVLQIRHASGVAEFNSFDIDGSARRDYVFNQYATEVLRITSGGETKFTVGTNKTVKFYAASHNDETNLGAGLGFSRQSDGAELLSGIFGHSNTGLGVAARDHITFLTGGTSNVSDTEERLRITSNGNLLVGIHTTSEAYTWSPRARFAVEGSGDASSIHLGLRYGGGVDPAIMMLRRGGSTAWHHHVGRIYTNHDPSIYFQTSFAAAPGSENFQTHMVMKHNAGVGIGTVDPKLNLHIHQNNSNAAFAHFTNTSTGYNSNQGLSIGIDSDENAAIYHYGSKNIRFATDNTQHMVLRSTGQLGIGTAFNPTANSKKLTLLCDSVGDGIWIANKENLYNAASTGYSDVRFTFYDYQTGGYTAGGEAIIRAYSRNAYAGSRSADLIFMTSPSDGSGTATEKLRITSDGQVQIPGGSTPFKVTHTGADCAQFHRGSRYLGINADWGGNTGDAVITVSDNFVIHTGGSNERLRISSSGLIQTSTRSAEVRRMILSGSPSNSAFNIEAHDGETGTASGDVQGKLGLFYNDGTTLTNTANISFERGSGAADGAMTFVTNQVERLRIDSSGKLGVGDFSSTSIAQALHVRGSAPEIYLEHTGGHDLTLTTSDGMGMNGITVNGGFLSLAYNNKDIVMCRTGGSVGINTTSPSRKLVVVDNLGGGIGVVGSNAGIYMGEHHTGGFINNCAIARAAANNYHITGSAVGDLCIAGEESQNILFGTSAHAGAMAERLRISHDGKVRIGNTNITTAAAADDLIIGPNTPAGDHGVTIVSGTSGVGNIYFADESTASYGNRMGTISYYHNGNFMRFSTSGNKESLRLGQMGNMTTATGSFRSRQEIKVDTLHMPQAHEGYSTTSSQSGYSVAANMFHQSHVRGTSHLTTELFSTRMGYNAGMFIFVEVWFSCAVANFQGYQALWANANRTGASNFTINNTGKEGHQLGTDTAQYFDLTYASSGSGGDQRLTWKVVTSFGHNYVRCLYKSTVVGHDYFVDFTTIR